MTGLLLSNVYKNIVMKLISKFIDMFPNKVLNFLNIFTEHGKIIIQKHRKKFKAALQECYCRVTIISPH